MFRNVAKVMRDYRESIGYSQIGLSNEFGFIGGQFVSNVERGLCSFPYKKLNLIKDEWKVKFVNAMVEDYKTRLIHSIAPKE